MVREAFLTALDDDVAFDKWFGAQVTRWVSMKHGVFDIATVVVDVVGIG